LLNEKGDGRGLEGLAGTEKGKFKISSELRTLLQQITGDLEVALEAGSLESPLDVSRCPPHQPFDDAEFPQIGCV
jgi:hypothetical protein